MTKIIACKPVFFILLIASLQLLVQLAVHGQTKEDYELIKKANEAYADTKFQEAVEIYQKLVKMGYTSWQLYYNLANAHYRTGDYKSAILNYERAKLINPDNENITTNLEFSQRYVQDKIESVPKFFLIRWIDGFTNMFSANMWAIISIFTFILFLICILTFLFVKSLSFRKMSFYLSIIAIFFAVISFYGSYKQDKKLTKQNAAIVFSSSVTVKSSPNESGTDLFIIHEGLKVSIIGKAEGWKEIKLSDGKVGWLPNETIVEI